MQPIPENVFIVAACNPSRGNSLSSHSQETWIRGAYYVRQLHPTLHFLMWNYGSLDEDQERDYINAKMKILNKQMPNAEVGWSVCVMHMCVRDILHILALPPFPLYTGGKSGRTDNDQSELDARLCLSPAQLRWAG